MHFALLGGDPDGLEMASALVESGCHVLAAYTTPAAEHLRRWGAGARRVGDVEEVLADPAVDLVIVAGGPGVRPAQLRRALQSERHVLCAHPADQSPEAAYEAAMLQKDTGCVLLPLLPAALHPAVRRLASFVERPGGKAAESPAGAFVLLEMEIASRGEVLTGLEVGRKPSFPGWDLLRALGGEVQEVTAFAEGEELVAGAPVLLAGRFERGGLFRATLLPRRPEDGLRFTLLGSAGAVELLLPQGWEGPAVLGWRDAAGERHEEYWERWDPWSALVEAFETALAPAPVPAEMREAIRQAPPSAPPTSAGPSWQDAVRCLELDDAARRSVERRRASALEYPEATEEAGFKGTMTLVGCAMVWGILLLLILSVWVPAAGWLIAPLLVLFLVLQLLRYLIPGPAKPEDKVTR
jgi:predicted dehydrogenase